MTKNKFFSVILAVVLFAAISNCGESEKSRIAATMCVYVESGLPGDKAFNFIGLSNRRDTIFMGESRPCAGVIYTITDKESGEKSRHYADVIFSSDYKTALSVDELNYDPIDLVEEKVKDAFKVKLRETIGK